MSSEHLCWIYLDYTYDPIFLFNRVNEVFKEYLKKHKHNIKPEDGRSFPFTLNQIELFLEATASMAFFIYKNDLKKSSDDCSVKMINRILIKPIDEFTCLDSTLMVLDDFKGRVDRIILDVYLQTLSEDDKEDDKVLINQRDLELKCNIDSVEESAAEELKFYPISVGYSMQHKTLSLSKLKVSKELKRDDYPLYLNVPYVSDFVAYTLRQ